MAAAKTVKCRAVGGILSRNSGFVRGTYVYLHKLRTCFVSSIESFDNIQVFSNPRKMEKYIVHSEINDEFESKEKKLMCV